MMHNEEVNDFRMKMLSKADSIQKKRKNWDWEKKACFLFPPRVESGLNLHGTLKRNVEANVQIHVSVKFMDNPVSNGVFS